MQHQGYQYHHTVKPKIFSINCALLWYPTSKPRHLSPMATTDSSPSSTTSNTIRPQPSPLHVPQITKNNILSAHQFTVIMASISSFIPLFSVSRIPAQGLSSFTARVRMAFTRWTLLEVAFLGERTSVINWHQHLCHLSSKIVSQVLSRNHLRALQNKAASNSV